MTLIVILALGDMLVGCIQFLCRLMNCWNKGTVSTPHLRLYKQWSMSVEVLVAAANIPMERPRLKAQQMMEVLMGKINLTKRNGLISILTAPIRRLDRLFSKMTWKRLRWSYIRKMMSPFHYLLIYVSLPLPKSQKFSCISSQLFSLGSASIISFCCHLLFAGRCICLLPLNWATN